MALPSKIIFCLHQDGCGHTRSYYNTLNTLMFQWSSCAGLLGSPGWWEPRPLIGVAFGDPRGAIIRTLNECGLNYWAPVGMLDSDSKTHDRKDQLPAMVLPTRV